MAHPCQSLIKNMSTRPGVYQMRSSNKTVLYVGKAKNLKNRLRSYFRTVGLSNKTRAMMQKVASIDVIITDTENEALLLEAQQIKQYRPRYNILLRDDKSYPYLRLTIADSFPRLDFYRGVRDDRALFYGPYANAGVVREMLALLQKVFQLRQCSDHFFRHRSRPCLQYQIKRCTAPCVGYVNADDYAFQVQQVKLFLSGKDSDVLAAIQQKMQDASEAQEYERAAHYRDQVTMLRQLQAQQGVDRGVGDVDVVTVAEHGDQIMMLIMFVRHGHLLGSESMSYRLTSVEPLSAQLMSLLTQFYLRSSAGRQLPSQILVMHALADVSWLQSALQEALSHPALRIRVVGTSASARDEASSVWLTLAKRNLEHALQQWLPGQQPFLSAFEALSRTLSCDALPSRLVAFDISHTQGEATVGACVVVVPAGFSHADYRRFNMKAITAGDDYAAMAQTVQRFYLHCKEKELPMPDCALIDGGLGQLHAVEKALEEIQISGVFLCAIAKGPARLSGAERIFFVGEAKPIQPAPDDPGFLFCRQVRDEVHRYAITGHRKKRAQARLQSSLENIAGIGAKKRADLLKYFGGLSGVRQAGVADLRRVPGISAALAERIYRACHPNDAP